MGTEIEFPGCGGLTGIDYGGSGPNVLLVHGLGQNAAVWNDVAQRLSTRARTVAVDLRGHGKSRLNSADAAPGAASSRSEHHWRDLADVIFALEWQRPILVGHASGGFAVAAVTAAELITPAAICAVDGFVLDGPAMAQAAVAARQDPAELQRQQSDHRYGWSASEAEMNDYVEQCVEDASASAEAFNAGAREELIRAVARRSFLQDGQRWIRRPTMEEITAVTDVPPDAAIYPSSEVYKRIQCPMTMVLASNGDYATRRDEVRAIINTRLNRSLVGVTCNHNVPMVCPSALTDIIINLTSRYRR
ncbi:MAG: alpha/beta hydrolase [Micromonosporaceae bacterium]|nr:alpha/beta hydrolase [Micromonosporaceae bacterium]